MKKNNYWLYASLFVAAFTLSACSSSDSGGGEDGGIPPVPDTEAPSVFILSPTSESTYVTIDAGLVISGTAQDDKAVSKVTYSTSRGAQGEATGTDNWSINGLNLPEGDTRVDIKAIDGGNNSATASITITKNKYLTFLGVPSHDKEMVYSNTSSPVWITARIAPNDKLVEGSVKVIEVDASGNYVADVCVLYDDGNLNDHSDEIKGDNVFSFRPSLYIDKEGVKYYRIVAETAETEGNVKGYSAMFSLNVVNQALVTQQVSNLMNTQQQIENAMENLPADVNAAAEQLKTLLEQDGNVLSVVKEEDMLKVTQKSGLESYIMLSESSDMKGAGNSGRRASKPAIPLYLQTRGVTLPKYNPAGTFLRRASVAPDNIIQNKDVLVWSAFADKFEDNMYDVLKPIFDSSPIGLNVTYITNDECTEGSLQYFSNYGLIIIDTHGMDGNLIFTRDELTEDDINNEEMLYNLFTSAVKMFTMRNGHTYAALTANFIKNALTADLPNTVVFNGSCESLKTDQLANAFISRGAKSYIGFSGKVSTKTCTAKAKQFFSALVGDGLKTTGEAFVEDINFTEIDGSTCSYLMRGSADMRFYLGLINGDFEYGKTAGWSVEGDGRVISKLESVMPTQGAFMGIVSTGLGYTTNYGSIRQTFRVTNETKLSMKWNYLSEEFLEYIGSQFMDYLKVTIILKDGTKEVLFEKNIDQFAEMFGASNGVQGNLINVYPEIVFDRGGVYMTGWQESVFDISSYQGKTVTLMIESGDVGDSIYDSVALLDEISVY